ncbi:capsule biosynthesis protein [Paracoccus rhizosphaerae]|uniref:Capsule biosynthesis protein n=1 Tax=Paracoccus rhizosphaerae TaxID=1133347 RepID=A0ABV6CM26_9RHOB|nr:capsule biosynthesis protein CapA [Paracoccus rhizosphaerae]
MLHQSSTFPLPQRGDAAATSAAMPGGQGRVFLMLQGPHGPFFDGLGRLLRAAGAQVWRCGFNAGDEFFWRDKASFIRYEGTAQDWPDHLRRILDDKGITDIILYGDVRPIHAAARSMAAERGIAVHVFEEGYLRPYWISYERQGANGNSVLLDIPLAQMRRVLREQINEVRRPPAHWGDMRQHKFYGAFYHFMILVANRQYRAYRGHRNISVRREFQLNLRRLLMTPVHRIEHMIQWRRLRLSGWPYNLVLMQLEHDSNFLGHSSFTRNAQFVQTVVQAFARSAPRHHHLVFKAHPLEDGRAGNRNAIRAAAEAEGVADRVHYVRGGKLAEILSHARAVVTVNSTGAQQALWRGIPVKALGRAVYGKPGLVSDQPLEDFLAAPEAPDPQAYRTFRDYLLQTSQIPGGYYASRSRAHALRLVADMLLSPHDPYDALAIGNVLPRQQLSDRHR